MDVVDGGGGVSMKSGKSEQELVEESEALRDTPEAWEEEAAAVKVRRPTREVVSFRLPTHELDRVEDAAAAAGLSLSEYVRRAVISHLDGPIRQGPSLDRFESSAMRLVVRHLYAGSSTESSESDVRTPDFPPLSAQGLLKLPFETRRP